MTRIPAGKRDTRVSFQRNGAGRSALGGKAAPSWSELFTRLASVSWGSSAERRNAAVEQAVQVCTFRVLADSQTRTVLATDRIVMTDAGGPALAFDITGIAQAGSPAPNELEFTCTASRGE